MHYRREGSGRPLLLVHGLGSSIANWQPVWSTLTASRDVIAVDLPGFGETPPLGAEVTVATLCDAVIGFLEDHDLAGVDLVGSSMGARMVLELARRGVGGDVVALDPGGFWSPGELKVFNASLTASIALIRAIEPALPTLTSNPVGRTALLAQFSARPWALPSELVLTELRTIADSPSTDAALHALVHGPRQQGAPAGSVPGRVTIGWGRQDRVTLPRQAARATRAFPDAELHWFSSCGHFPHWDQPEQAAALVLASTGG